MILRRWGDDNEAVKATRSNPSWRDPPGRLARDFDVPPNRIGAIVNGTRSITADTALRLGIYFGVSPETWLGLQLDYDLRLIRQRDGDRIVSSVRTPPAA
jgi:addiction module HigA family antidote